MISNNHFFLTSTQSLGRDLQFFLKKLNAREQKYFYLEIATRGCMRGRGWMTRAPFLSLGHAPKGHLLAIIQQLCGTPRMGH